jgi:kynurenine formamidase
MHIDYSDCEGEDKFRVMKVKMHAGIGTHMDATGVESQ